MSRYRDDEQPVLETLPVSAEDAPKALSSVWGLFEVLLKAPDRLNPFVRLPAMQPTLCFGFTAITLVGMTLYAVGMYAGLYFVPKEARPDLIAAGWDGGIRGLVGLLAAYPVGILVATLVVLPTYWFFGLLCGVRMPVGEVLTHSLKGKAASTVLVVGLMPVYGVILGCLILAGAPGVLLNPVIWVGLVLPFLAAFRGAGAIEAGFRNVVATTPELTRGGRESIPTSLTLLWALLFTLTVPVVMYRAWQLATGWLGGGA